MIIGLDIGGTNIKGVLINGKQIIASISVPVQSRINRKMIINQISECIKSLKGKKKIAGIGIGVASPVDFKEQKILNPPNIRGLKNLQLGKIIAKKFGVKTAIDNDVHSMVFAEVTLGAAKGKKSVVGLAIGTGVGGGIFMDGKIVRGKNGTAGELGHMTIIKNGWKCSCGSKGCLEAYIAESGQERLAKELLGRKMDSIVLQKLAEKGNKKAIKAWKIIGENLGLGLANIVDTLNPEVIVVGGGIARAGKLLFGPAIATMKKNIVSKRAKNTKVVSAKLGKFSGAIGATLLTL
jgi:glucokinase